MENYTIKQNDYVAPKVRKEVVQRLLNFYYGSIGTCDCIFNISGHCQTYGLVCEKQTNENGRMCCIKKLVCHTTKQRIRQ